MSEANRHNEFRSEWRALLAATLGLSSAMGVISYINSVVAPYLLQAFGWSKAEFAMTGALALLTLVFIPIAGRLADIFGPRRVAALGIVMFPLSYALLATVMNGNIRIYVAILVAQVVLCATTTTTVYSRVVAERFRRRRGLALAIFAAGPAVVGGVGSPLLTAWIDRHGWQSGYFAVALFSAVGGALTFLLLPAGGQSVSSGTRASRSALRDYRDIVRNGTFWTILLSALLCSLPHALSISQLKVMLIEHHVSSTEAGYMVSVFAAGVLVGRVLCGIALDRMPAYLVAAIGMGLPCVGLLLLAIGVNQLPLIALAVGLLGLSFGAEGDILTYLAARYFSIEVYSTVVGMVMAAVGTAMALGAGLLGFTLTKSESFVLFMAIGSASAFIGGLNFLRLHRAQEFPAAVVLQP